MAVTIDELVVGDPPGAWSALGFEVEGDVCVVGDVRVRLAGDEAGKGLVAWSLREVADGDYDGLRTARSEAPVPEASAEHPNGITELDHIVVVSPDLERTIGVLENAGLNLRRVREEPTPAGAPRQGFFRLGSNILEVVQEPAEATAEHGGDRPAFFWGLAFVAPDIEQTASGLGDHAGSVRDAVQPGRRIATLRRSAGLSVPVALMSPG